MLFRTHFTHPLLLYFCLLSPGFGDRQDVVASSDLETTFDMIGGLGDLRDEIMDIVSLVAFGLQGSKVNYCTAP